jgi:hypothetical protein
MSTRSAIATVVTVLAAVLTPVGVTARTAAAAGSSTGTSVIDQSFQSTDNSNNLINEGARFAAQTFTAGRTGLLTGVSVDVFDCCNSRFALSLAIRTVGPDDVPTDLVLGETRTQSCCPPLSQIVTLPNPVRVVAGTRYAIVASYPDAPFAGSGSAQGAWLGSNTDAYPGGRALAYYSIPPVGPGWIESGGSHDLNFRTYVQATPSAPTTKDACKRDGWRTVADGSGKPFRNQGQCISYVEHHNAR